MSDGSVQINAVRRQVGTKVIELGEARTMTIGQTYDAPLDDVWDACTSVERISRWLMPISGDLRLGGRYQLEGNAGGVVERCDPPRGFAATWEYGGEISWIEVRLGPEPDGGTRVEVEHIFPADEQRWAEFGPGAVGIGWDMMFLGLAMHLTSGAGLDQAEAAAWVVSGEGRAFMSASSELWREASVAAGTDPGEARAAADRVFAAYTAAGRDGAEGGPAAG